MNVVRESVSVVERLSHEWHAGNQSKRVSLGMPLRRKHDPATVAITPPRRPLCR